MNDRLAAPTPHRCQAILLKMQHDRQAGGKDVQLGQVVAARQRQTDLWV